MSASIHVNGEERTVDDTTTLADVVADEAEEDFEHVAAAVNDEIVSRGEWDDVTFNDGDEVEVVQPIQGGSE